MPRIRIYTISEAAQLLGKEGNRKLIRRLIRFKKIETFAVGRSVCIDQDGFDILAEAVREWDGRLCHKTLATAS